MASVDPVKLTEDQLDDLIYFARAGQLEELKDTVDDLSKSLPLPHDAVLAAAVDPQEGTTMLHMAVANGHEDVVRYILTTLGASTSTTSSAEASGSLAPSSISHVRPDPSSGDPSPTTARPAHAIINHPNSSLSTPLHWAAVNGQLGCVRLLVDAGADLNAENSAKHDPLASAERAGRTEVVRYLMQRMGGKSGDEEVRDVDVNVDVDGTTGAQEDDMNEGDGGIRVTQNRMESLGLDEESRGTMAAPGETVIEGPGRTFDDPSGAHRQ